MYGDDISLILSRFLSKSRVKYLGTFSADKIPSHSLVQSSSPCCYVLNSDPSTSPGSHWVAVYHSTPHSLEFFDSFGFAPADLGFHFDTSFHVTQNKTQVQSLNSKVCGEYCIYFVYLRSVGISFSDIIKRLSSQTHSKSDSRVNSFVQSLRQRLRLK